MVGPRTQEKGLYRLTGNDFRDLNWREEKYPVCSQTRIFYINESWTFQIAILNDTAICTCIV